MIANIFIFISMISLLFGVYGINRLEGVIPKLLTSSLIDTVAFISLTIGLIIRSGINDMSIKLMIVLVFILITNPVINHIITKAAYIDQNRKNGVVDGD